MDNKKTSQTINRPCAGVIDVYWSSSHVENAMNHFCYRVFGLSHRVSDGHLTLTIGMH